jgi:4-hydroxy-2-oxoheptanedioate aldolase
MRSIGMKNLKEITANGGVVIGTFVFFPSPASVEILGYAGFDFVIIDVEHGPCGPFSSELENLIRAAYAADITPLVKLTRNDSGMILKALDFGAKGILVPHVVTKEDAINAVNSAKYPLKGRRSCAPIVRAAQYGSLDWSTYWKQANQETMVWPIIEEKNAIGNLEDILSVEGIDCVAFGPFDLSMSLGTEGDPLHPAVKEKLHEVLDACKKRDIPVQILAMDVEAAKKYVQMGVKIVAISADTVILHNACKDIVKKANREIRTSR